MSPGELDGVDVGVPPLHGEAHAEGADDDPLRRAAAIAAFLMAGLGAVSTLLFVAAFQFRSAWFADPAVSPPLPFWPTHRPIIAGPQGRRSGIRHE